MPDEKICPFNPPTIPDVRPGMCVRDKCMLWRGTPENGLCAITDLAGWLRDDPDSPQYAMVSGISFRLKKLTEAIEKLGVKE